MQRYPLKKIGFTGTIISQLTIEMRSKRGFANPNIRPDIKIRAALAFFDGGKKPAVTRCLLSIDFEKSRFLHGTEPVEAINADEMFKKVEEALN